MSLTGTPLVVLLVVLAAALPLLAGALRLRGRSDVPPVRRGAVRSRRAAAAAGVAGLVVAGQVAAVLAAGAVVNDYGDFYTSWSELAGHEAAVPPAVAVGPVGADRPGGGRSGGVLAAAAPGTAVPAGRLGRVVQGPDPAWAPPARWPVAGRLERVTVTGGTTGLSSSAYVWLPPQWFAPGADRRTFPAALVMTGYPGSALNLERRLQLPQQVLARTAAGKAAPMVLVLVSPSVVMPRDTECTDVYAGPQVETFLAVDLPAALGPRYRVRPGDWGTVGDSTGGWCAVKLAMDHPATFPAAVSLSGYYHPLSDRTTGSLWGGSPALRDLNDPRWRLQHLPVPPVSVLATSSRGETGPTGYPDLQAFARLVRPPMRLDTIVLPSGGHNFATWRAETPAAVDWLSARLAAAAGAAGPPTG